MMRLAAGYLVKPGKLILSNPAAASELRTKNNRTQYHDLPTKQLFDVCKKSLAFILDAGVASIPVQGLKVACGLF